MRSVLDQTEAFVRQELLNDSSGHDWWHIHRVRRLAIEIARAEGADVYIVELAALLHDISDYKLNGGDHTIGPRIAYEWLISLGESEEIASKISRIIATMSFAGAGDRRQIESIEGMVVQDADRLDAIGAIGIARAFTFGGFAGQAMHNPERRAVLHRTAEEYFARSTKDGTTINHFYEKLLLLSDRMNTGSARRIAAHRHKVIESFLSEFLREWDATDATDILGE
jgi:Predicted HD superfamily hydrolase